MALRWRWRGAEVAREGARGREFARNTKTYTCELRADPAQTSKQLCACSLSTEEPVAFRLPSRILLSAGVTAILCGGGIGEFEVNRLKDCDAVVSLL